jgi:hypothetical protein
VKTIRCSTKFDITATGVQNQFKQDSEYHDRVAWTKARNQQRNWETINQILALRCLPENITQPCREGDEWWFEFSLESLSALSHQPDDLEFLLKDADGVPMLLGLDETAVEHSTIQTLGPEPNTEFRLVFDKYSTGENYHGGAN